MGKVPKRSTKYTSFTKVGISKEDYEFIESQDCNCEICNIIKSKLNDYF